MKKVYSLTGCDDTGDHSSCVLLPANPTHNQNLHYALCGCVTLPGTQIHYLQEKKCTQNNLSYVQLMLMVSVFASDHSDTTRNGCAAIAIFLHLTVILQFVWILAVVSSTTKPVMLIMDVIEGVIYTSNDALSCQALSLWMNFMGFTDGKEPVIIYTIVCWGKP